MNPLEVTVNLRRTGTPHVLVTVVSARGSTPQDAGSKIVVAGEGLLAGTVGGGRIEAAAIDHALKILSEGTGPEMVTWNLQRDIAMTCGGEMQLFFEPFEGSSWTIAIFGAGHVAQALIPVLAPLPCTISCFDTRSSWLDAMVKAPNITAVQREELAAGLADLPSHAFVLLMTQGHSTDFPILRDALANHNFPFLGVIGSASKRATLERDLRSAGIAPERASAFQCPIGLSLGSNHPQEIAISIAAQLLQFRDRTKNSKAT